MPNMTDFSRSLFLRKELSMPTHPALLFWLVSMRSTRRNRWAVTSQMGSVLLAAVDLFYRFPGRLHPSNNVVRVSPKRMVVFHDHFHDASFRLL